MQPKRRSPEVPFPLKISPINWKRRKQEAGIGEGVTQQEGFRDVPGLMVQKGVHLLSLHLFIGIIVFPINPRGAGSPPENLHAF